VSVGKGPHFLYVPFSPFLPFPFEFHFLSWYNRKEMIDFGRVYHERQY
jgi:hypothetical protein